MQLKPRAAGASGQTIGFIDGSELQVDAVIWATGYRLDHSWINLPSGDGLIPHKRGVTEVPGLYFLGLQWQYTRGSALLGWVKDDAEYIAGRIDAFERSQTRRSSLATTHEIARTEASEAEVPA